MIVSRLKNFVIDGIWTTFKEVNHTKIGHGAIVASSCLISPSTSIVLTRIVLHESSHFIEAKLTKAQPRPIRIHMKRGGIGGETVVDGTTPDSAMRIALAGYGTDIGFLLTSLMTGNIAGMSASLMTIADTMAFLEKDYKVYRSAKQFKLIKLIQTDHLT